jgi:class 3 adenylate cyclase
MTGLLERAYRRLGPRYLVRALFLQQQMLYAVIVLVVAGLSAYVEMSLGEFLRLALLACGFQFLYSVLSLPLERRLSAPVAAWLEGARTEEGTTTAWRAAASLPWELIRRGFTEFPVNLVWSFYLLWALYVGWELELPAYYALFMYVGAVVLLLYAVALRFFSAEQVVRPVLHDIAAALPDGAAPAAPGLPVRARLLAALPAINVITAVAAHALTRGGDAELADLAIVVLIATAVAGTLSLVLTLLLSDSISEPLAELREATKRLGAGDFGTRVPVVTTDETGDLARSFNEMAAGLEERERIREAFGTYVDREVAEHILTEGTSLAGEEVEVTMMFLDVRDFTGFAERASAPAVVATLNRLFEQVVPIIHEHGGHVDKFVGDGLLAVFGAPRRQADHANQALAAALEVARRAGPASAGELEIGIGLNSGLVVAGNVGGAGRLEFSVIGDAVNVAARVEAATRQTGDTVLIAERTRELLGGTAIPLEQRPGVTLKGKRKPVELYAPRTT